MTCYSSSSVALFPTRESAFSDDLLDAMPLFPLRFFLSLSLVWRGRPRGTRTPHRPTDRRAAAQRWDARNSAQCQLAGASSPWREAERRAAEMSRSRCDARATTCTARTMAGCPSSDACARLSPAFRKQCTSREEEGSRAESSWPTRARRSACLDATRRPALRPGESPPPCMGKEVCPFLYGRQAGRANRTRQVDAPLGGHGAFRGAKATPGGYSSPWTRTSPQR